MKPPIRLVAGRGLRPVGFDAVLRALADLADVRADADGPVLTWLSSTLVDEGRPTAPESAPSGDLHFSARQASQAGGERAENSLRCGTVVLGTASFELRAMLVNLDGDRPMLPFLRERGRRMRGLDDFLTVEAGHPLVHLARMVDAAAASDRDLIRALATGAIVVGDVTQAQRLGLDAALVGPAPSDERAEAARSAAAANAARRFDPRSIAVELMNGAGIGSGSVRHAVVELHRGALDRIDGRVARLVGTKGMGAWA